jgi:ATP-dependent DNA ligase
MISNRLSAGWSRSQGTKSPRRLDSIRSCRAATFERRHDGIRLIVFREAPDVRLYSRNRLPQHVPHVRDAIAALPVRDVILDGELS